MDIYNIILLLLFNLVELDEFLIRYNVVIARIYID